MDRGIQSRGEKHPDLKPRNCTSVKGRQDERSETSSYVVNSEKSSNDLTERVAPSSFIPANQRRKLFNGSLKLSKTRWVSMSHEKPSRKNRVLKTEKSLDDAAFLKEKRGGSHYCESSSAIQESPELDTLPEEICLEAYSETPRRGSICEELEKEIFQGGISLHKMRKAMVIQETLKDRFLIWTWSENTLYFENSLCSTQCWKTRNSKYCIFRLLLQGRAKMTGKNRDNVVCFFHWKIYTKSETSKFEITMAACIHMSINTFHRVICSWYDVFWLNERCGIKGVNWLHVYSEGRRLRQIFQEYLNVFSYHYG